MKTKLSLSLYFLLVIGMFGCSMDVAQPAVLTPLPSAAPTLPVNTGATSAVASTTVPVTWANMNLAGSLVYTSPSVTGDASFFIGIRKLNLITGEITPIFTTTGDDWIFYVSVSPDAKQLIMSYMPPSQGTSISSRALYILPMDGSAPPQPLFAPPTPDDHYLHAEWSPDGRYIYYVHYNKLTSPEGQPLPTYTLFRMTHPDGKPEKIADQAFWPRLSADSSKLAYVSIDPVSGTNELFLANADGSDVQKIDLRGPWALDVMDAPIFSPDGGSILFSAPPPPQAYQPNWFESLMRVQVARAHSIPSDWWAVSMSGGTPTRLTQLQTINLFGSLSPDQKHLASVSGEGLFVMDLDGSNLTQLLFNPGVSGTVSWIP